MANGMFDLTGWRIMTPEESQEQRWRDDAERAELDAHWPPSQRRNRCMNCGAFMRRRVDRWTRCKRCDESYESLQ
jgi:hypothetical protein